MVSVVYVVARSPTQRRTSCTGDMREAVAAATDEVELVVQSECL